jgi:hypothetical protein
MSADSVPSSKTNIFQSKFIYCRHFRTYSRCAMFDWSDTVFRRKNLTRRRISNTVLQTRYWGREASHPRFVDCWPTFPFSATELSIVNKIGGLCQYWGVDGTCGDNRWICFEKYWSLMKVRNQPTLRRMKIYYYWTNIRKWNYFNTSFIEDFRK